MSSVPVIDLTASSSSVAPPLKRQKTLDECFRRRDLHERPSAPGLRVSFIAYGAFFADGHDPISMPRECRRADDGYRNFRYLQSLLFYFAMFFFDLDFLFLPA